MNDDSVSGELSDDEYRSLVEAARSAGVTVGEWYGIAPGTPAVDVVIRRRVGDQDAEDTSDPDTP